MLDLRPEDLQLVQKILKEQVPGMKVLVFGSRAKGTAKKHSDLDLALVGSAPLSFSQLGILKEAFMESDLPFKVDVVDWHRISPEFQELIEKEAVVLE